MKQALQEASKADVIIVAGAIRGQLSEWMSLLFNKLRFERKLRQGALVALLPNPTAQSSILRKFAQWVGMDFFCPRSLAVTENSCFNNWNQSNTAYFYGGTEAKTDRCSPVICFHE